MNGFQVLGINHTSFTVSDLDRSVAFYTDALGFELLHRGDRDPEMISKVVGVDGADIEVAYIQMPGHRLELIQYKGPADKGKVVSSPLRYRIRPYRDRRRRYRCRSGRVRAPWLLAAWCTPGPSARPKHGRPGRLYARFRRCHGRIHPKTLSAPALAFARVPKRRPTTMLYRVILG